MTKGGSLAASELENTPGNVPVPGFEMERVARIILTLQMTTSYQPGPF